MCDMSHSKDSNLPEYEVGFGKVKRVLFGFHAKQFVWSERSGRNRAETGQDLS